MRNKIQAQRLRRPVRPSTLPRMRAGVQFRACGESGSLPAQGPAERVGRCQWVPAFAGTSGWKADKPSGAQPELREVGGSAGEQGFNFGAVREARLGAGAGAGGGAGGDGELQGRLVGLAFDEGAGEGGEEGVAGADGIDDAD